MDHVLHLEQIFVRDGIVGYCSCGWESPPRDSMVLVVDEWENHVEAAAATVDTSTP